MRTGLTAALLLLTVVAFAQTRKEFFDFRFKPSEASPYYYVITQKTDSGWHREAYFVSQKTMAMQGTYKDEAGTVEHGWFEWYHPTRYQRTAGRYANGKKEGLWLGFDDKGNLIDSTTYAAGRRVGTSLRWHSNGMTQDSVQFDNEGNGTDVSWYDDGKLYAAGRWKQDTLKTGRWKYYHKNGTSLADVDYVDGKKTACTCYDESGQALDTAACTDKAAEPGGGIRGWRRFLETNLSRLIEQKASSREWGVGKFTVFVRFLVEKDGSLTEFVPLTQYGKGVEDDVIKMLKLAPNWTPGRQWGRPVRSYHTQPITFQIR